MIIVIMVVGEMKTNHLDKMIGQFCKIVTKEPGDLKAHVVTGTIHEIDHQTKQLMVKSSDGFYCLNIKAIVAMKPKKKENF
jgi:hypothetical protein